jgi:hypothetical protein
MARQSKMIGSTLWSSCYILQELEDSYCFEGTDMVIDVDVPPSICSQGLYRIDLSGPKSRKRCGRNRYQQQYDPHSNKGCTI